MTNRASTLIVYAFGAIVHLDEPERAVSDATLAPFGDRPECALTKRARRASIPPRETVRRARSLPAWK